VRAIIVAADVLARRRAEREKQRRERAALVGSILDPLDHEDNPQRAPASQAPRRRRKDD
jgi:hypothetical protein